MTEDIGGQREGRQPTEQAREPSMKSFLLPRLRRKGEVQPAASKAGAPEGPAFLSSPCKALAKELPFRFTLGAGRPPPSEPPSHKLPVASCLGARSPHGSEDHWAPPRSRAGGLLSNPGAQRASHLCSGWHPAHPLTSRVLSSLLKWSGAQGVAGRGLPAASRAAGRAAGVSGSGPLKGVQRCAKGLCSNNPGRRL